MSYAAVGVDPPPTCPSWQTWSTGAQACVDLVCDVGEKAYYGECVPALPTSPPTTPTTPATAAKSEIGMPAAVLVLGALGVALYAWWQQP